MGFFQLIHKNIFKTHSLIYRSIIFLFAHNNRYNCYSLKNPSFPKIWKRVPKRGLLKLIQYFLEPYVTGIKYLASIKDLIFLDVSYLLLKRGATSEACISGFWIATLRTL